MCIRDRLDGLELAGLTESAEQTGGDYYDFVPMSNGDYGLVVGDVTGHGIGPALLMAETRAYLRILAADLDDVGEILTRANRVLTEDTGSERFVTLLFVRLSPKTGTVRYASAGHPPALWLDGSGHLKRELKRTGIPLGIRPDTEYTVSEDFPLEPGDLLALMTDGVEESTSEDGEMFGKERIVQTLGSHQVESAAEIVAGLHEAGRSHEAADHQPNNKKPPRITGVVFIQLLEPPAPLSFFLPKLSTPSSSTLNHHYPKQYLAVVRFPLNALRST